MTTYPESWQRHPEWIDAERRDPHFAGVHYYQSLLGCLKRAHLPGDADGGADADFGTSVHAWLHQYHTSGDASTARLSDAPPPRSCSEVQLAERYAARFPAHSLGKVRMAETRLRGSLVIDGEEYPIAGTLDAVSEMNANACWEFRRNGVTLEPGIYAHDFKTSKSKGELTLPRHMHGEQAPFYVELLRQARPDLAASLRGFLFHILYRYVADREDNSQFQTIALGVPDADAERRVRGLVRDGAAALRRHGPDWVVPTHCFDWNRECPAMVAGCARTNIPLDIV